MQTPLDLATSIADMPVAPSGDVNWSTSATYCYSGGVANVADDQRTWD